MFALVGVAVMCLMLAAVLFVIAAVPLLLVGVHPPSKARQSSAVCWGGLVLLTALIVSRWFA